MTIPPETERGYGKPVEEVARAICCPEGCEGRTGSGDDDLEAYASIKPWAKRAIQVDREIDRRIIERRSVFQRIVDGLDVHKSDVPDWWYFG